MASTYAACPKCGAGDPVLTNFTWWGGAIGPRILTHVKCQGCGYKYNGKSGKDNTTGIIIYSVVVGGIGFILIFFLFFWLAAF